MTPFFLETTLNKLGLSISTWNRILKVSRTIADLKQQQIKKIDIIEAISYRSMDKLLIQLQKKLHNKGVLKPLFLDL